MKRAAALKLLAFAVVLAAVFALAAVAGNLFGREGDGTASTAGAVESDNHHAVDQAR